MNQYSELEMRETMRVLVTGGAGFIGSHIVDLLLAAGHEVAVLDDLSSGSRDDVAAGAQFHRAHLCDAVQVRAIMDQVKPDAVCHHAAQISVSRSVREPIFDAQANILGLLHILQEGARVGVRRVTFASSGGTLYGDTDRPAVETLPCAPISPYGISKWTGERYLEFYAREFGLHAVALRYSNVYGPRQNPHGEAGVVAIFCNRLLAGSPATLNGEGSCIRDYVYVTDVARANLLALTHELPSEFAAVNIATGVGTSVKQLEIVLRRHLQHHLGRAMPEPILGPPRPGDLRSSVLCAEKAQKILRWMPETDLDSGLLQTARWFVEESRATGS